MFVQVMKGKVADADLLARQMDAWRADVKPKAIGFLGSTSGVTPDGTAIVVARFESQAAAQANSERPEQGAWWAATAPAFDGDVSFTDCPEVDLMFDGGSNNAGFVQILEGRAVDPAALRSAGEAMSDALHAMRPDILGGVVGWHGDRQFVQAVYFTSQDDARKGEASAQDNENSAQWAAMMDGPMTFYDLNEPAFD
jgi:hypothetical protein